MGAAVVGNIAFLSALKIPGSTRISIFGILQRPILIIMSAIILREKLEWYQFLGIAMVLIGIRFARVIKKDKKVIQSS